MGIVNVTPDSFSGDGRLDVQSAVLHGVAQHHQGADVLDVGGESSRPGSHAISDSEEIARVVPVIQELRERLPQAMISVDTYKPKVALAAYHAGANIVNSVWGAPDPLLDCVARAGIPIVIMHNSRAPLGGKKIMDKVLASLTESSHRAMLHGIARDHIILDPGIGFAKTADQNIEILANLKDLVQLGFPTLLGTSRKSTLGLLTGRSNPHERVAATTATTAFAVAAGIDIVRVHDVAEARDAVCVADAIVRDWRPTVWTTLQ